MEHATFERMEQEERKRAVLAWLEAASASISEALARGEHPKSPCVGPVDPWLKTLLPPLDRGDQPFISDAQAYQVLLDRLSASFRRIETVLPDQGEPIVPGAGFSVIIRPPWLLYTKEYDCISFAPGNALRFSGFGQPVLESSHIEARLCGAETLAAFPLAARIDASRWMAFVEWMESHTPIDLDTVLRWPDQERAAACFFAGKIEKELCTRYNDLRDRGPRMARAVELLASWDQDTPIARLLGLLEDRQEVDILAEYRFFQVGEALLRLQERLYQLDAEKAAFHRRLEAFSLVFLGKSRLAVIAALESARPGQWPIFRDVYAKYQPNPSHGEDAFKDGLAIVLGSGPFMAYADGYDGDPAPDPEYESHVDPARSREDDELLAERIIDRLAREFPFLDAKSLLYVTGSYHEKFAGYELMISQASLIRQAEVADVDFEPLVQKILTIVRAVIEREA